MVGQGGPQTSRAPMARPARARPWLCRAALLAFCLACLAVSQVLAAEEVLQLRIAWGGGAERIWHGTIRLSAGRFSELQPLGIEADEPGSIWLAKESIEIQQRSLRAYDGVDVQVTADLDAQLVIALASEPGEAAKPTEISLRTLVSQSQNSSLDDAGNRLLVSRSPSDRLRVNFDRDHLVFSPGEDEFIGKEGTEGDPQQYALKFWPANNEFGALRIIVRGDYGHFQVGPSKEGKYLNFFHSALRLKEPKRGFALSASGGPTDKEHWVRFDNFRVVRNK